MNEQVGIQGQKSQKFKFPLRVVLAEQKPVHKVFAKELLVNSKGYENPII